MSIRTTLIASLLLSFTGLATVPERPFPPAKQHLQDLLPELDIPYYFDITPPLDPEFSKQWWLKNIGQPDGSGKIGKAGADIKMMDALEAYDPKEEVILAIIDSGLDMTHEDLDYENLWVNHAEKNGIEGVDDDGNGYIDDIHGWNMVHQRPDIQDTKGHGSHVGGMISAISNNHKGIFGRVPGVRVMVIKIWDKGGDIFKSHAGEAIRYACDNGARVLSNSYGTPSANQETKEAIAYCEKKGALFVVAAGNVGQDLDIDPIYPASFKHPNILSVGASDNQDGRATFSNYGKTIDIMAPGDSIYSLKFKNRYKYSSGTSQACPLVALTAAMTLAHTPSLNYAELKKRVVVGADEKKRLKRWSNTGRRLNTKNTILGDEGERLQKHDFSMWKEIPHTLETPHPYPRRKTVKLSYSKKGAKRLRLYFSRFEVSTYDTVTVKDANENIIERYNGSLAPFWSQVIEGDRVTVELTSGSGPLNYGFLINKVQFEK